MVAANHGDKLVRIVIGHSLIREFLIVGFGIIVILKNLFAKSFPKANHRKFCPSKFLWKRQQKSVSMVLTWDSMGISSSENLRKIPILEMGNFTRLGHFQ